MFYIVHNSNDDQKFCIANVPASSNSLETWNPALMPDADVSIDDVEFFHDRIFIFGRKDGYRIVQESRFRNEELTSPRTLMMPMKHASIEPFEQSVSGVDNMTIVYFHSSVMILSFVYHRNSMIPACDCPRLRPWCLTLFTNMTSIMRVCTSLVLGTNATMKLTFRARRYPALLMMGQESPLL